jgi:hypothetical protein
MFSVESNRNLRLVMDCRTGAFGLMCSTVKLHGRSRERHGRRPKAGCWNGWQFQEIGIICTISFEEIDMPSEPALPPSIN